MRFLECLKSAGKIPHGLWSMMKKSSVSRMQRFMYSQILCLSWKGERTQHQILFGSDSLGWFKETSQHRILDTIDGEPTELQRNIFPGFTKFPRIHYIAAWPRSPKVHGQNWSNQNNSKDELFHFDVQ